MIFEVAIVENPTKKEREEGVLEKLIVPPTHIVAHNDKAASMQVMLANKDKLIGDGSRMEVIVRPFA